MRLNRSLVATTVVAVAASLAAFPSGSATANDQKPVPTHRIAHKKADPDAVAEGAAAQVVSARAPQLYLSRYDKVQAQPTLRSGPLRFVPYLRTYKGLPVDGGDFVVVVDGDGDVVSTSVAQTGKVRLTDVSPSITSSAARSTTAAKVRGAQLSRSRLVVLQRGARSSLAWKTTATGRRAGQPSRLDVYVDADSGRVLETKENVAAGDGHAAYSGPDPLALGTTHTGSTYSMTTPGANTLVCQDADNNTTFSGPDDDWGNGDASDRETGCVDALYAAQQERLMLRVWLGRNGMNGAGGWVPIRVGLDDLNAFYDGYEVQVGHNSVGDWIGSLDVIAHEFGHGIDDSTPGGISGNGTQEFVADTFGASTEAYDNQPAPYDQPDYLVGEEIDLTGDGPIRNMYNPSLVGDPNCYSAAVDSGEVHAAAGPGNHWFYLLAVGSNAAGQPVSPRCGGAPAVEGIGIKKAMKIMYTAMLMKTSASSYKNYRSWTLTAARYLYGQTSCTEFNRVKAAWTAVSVPALPGETTCTVGQPAVSITNATSRTVNADRAIPAFTLTATGGTSPYTWSATGLPTGATINSATGQVSGTLGPATAGSYVVEVTATDSAARVGKAWFTMQVNGSPTLTCTGQRIGNPGFENQIPAPWAMNAGAIYGDAPHSGARYAWLGGYGEVASDVASQTVKIPTGCKAVLTFWLNSDTEELGSGEYDTLTVKANSFTMKTYSNRNVTNGWVKQTLNVPQGFAGANVTFSFTSDEDSSLATSFRLDDFALTLSK
ncbi:M4 family metallopeptidase [Nocardioides sp. MH1]|uniref:M4 family metallopeptidase n=1 Tax=Nocardioides sp. MH1 TaxID=3242490 RepID=UPI003521DBB0